MAAFKIIQSTHQLAVGKIQPDLFQRFTLGCIRRRPVTVLAATTGKSHLARPGIVHTESTLDEDDLRVFQGEARVQYKCDFGLP
jgi:hypothetical protein